MFPEKNTRVAVLIIAYQESISKLELVSLRQCLSILNEYEIIIVKPGSLNISSWPIDHNLVKLESFPDHYFRDIGSYSRLLLAPKFYKRFQSFEYVLIHQLDAFVFHRDLISWCNKGLDFIGAPWFENFSSSNQEASLMRVGNGGFSLRNVKTHLKVLRSFSYLSKPRENWNQRMKEKPAGKKWLLQFGGFILDMSVRNNTFWLLNSYMGFEDQFWSLVAPRNFKWFIIPDPEDAIKFSFEMQPRRLFKMNHQQLPFGCHAWWKYDLDFWKPHIEKFGYALEQSKAVAKDQGAELVQNRHSPGE